jgi:hypothetical protein
MVELIDLPPSLVYQVAERSTPNPPMGENMVNRPKIRHLKEMGMPQPKDGM